MIVVADDFGLTQAVNDGVVAAYAEGLVTHASIMVGTFAFEPACHLAREHGIPVGLHLALTDSKALTEPITRCPRFCTPTGELTYTVTDRRLLVVTPREATALNAELGAQIRRAQAHGLTLTHLDSHFHVHTEPALAPLVIALARRYGVPRVRLAQNLAPMARKRRLTVAAINRLIAAARLDGGVAGFGDYATVTSRRDVTGAVELMTHPAIVDGELVDAYTGGPLAAQITAARG